MGGNGFGIPVKCSFSLLAAFVGWISTAYAVEEAPIRWLVEYDGKKAPAGAWTAQGAPEAEVRGDALHLTDGTADGFGFYRAEWKAEPGMEIVVEATVRVIGSTGTVAKKADSSSVWPWRDGAPVSVLVSDGQHEEGLALQKDRIFTWTDRFAALNAADGFRSYRLTIRGADMAVAVDGEVKIRGQNAFWHAAVDATPFIQFGSSSKAARGEAEWRSVRLGVRPLTAVAPPPVRIKVSEPWPILRPELKTKPTRPYVYNIGNGVLLMSLAEGPDALYEPYGVLRSDDAGKTWKPVEGLDVTEQAPLPMHRLKDFSVVGMSRWTWPQEDGSYRGQTVTWPADLSSFKMAESRLQLPAEYRPAKVPFTCERHVFERADGTLLMAGYSKTGPSTPEGLRAGRRFSHLLASKDRGHTWAHFSVVGPGGEPAIAQTGEHSMTAVLRTGPFRPFVQTFSEDDGATWSAPVVLEEGSVCPDLVPMSNGLLACSYGRPASCLMFSADGGHTWSSHFAISDKPGFNYSGIVEVQPGRLLYMHDGGGLQAMYIDVERDGIGPAPVTEAGPPAKKPTTDYALRTAKELKPDRKVVYKTVGARKLELHLFEPRNTRAGAKRPCFLAIHGGGWVAGTPDVMYCVASHFAERGWLGISMQYRIARKDRDTTVFYCVQDVRSAMRYLRAHADELGIDANRIVAGGRSAGGHLAAAAALFDGLDEPGEETSVSCVPNACALYSAVLDTSEQGYGNELIGERWREVSPLLHVRAGLPPTIVLHGMRDTTAPTAGAQAFAEAMKKAGNRCELILNQKGSHSYMMRTEALFTEAMAQTEEFLRGVGIEFAQ